MTVPLDGRLARSVRTRAAVIDALIALYEEGDLSPTAVRVAERAGVALRTVYGHFADIESLYAEAGDRELTRLLERSDQVDPGLPFEERVRRFAANRAAVLEWLLPVMRAAATREALSPQLQRNRRRFVAAGDAEVRQVFAVELAGSEDPEALVARVHVVAAGAAWMTLRLDRGLAAPQAESALHALLRAVLTDG